MPRIRCAVVVITAVALLTSALPAAASAGEPPSAVSAAKRCKKGYKAKKVGKRVRCVRNHKAVKPLAKTTYTGTVEGLSGISFARTCNGTRCDWFLQITIPLGPGCNAAMMNGIGTETASGGLTGTIGATDVKAKVSGTFTATTFVGKVTLAPPLPAACTGIPKTSYNLQLAKA